MLNRNNFLQMFVCFILLVCLPSFCCSQNKTVSCKFRNNEKPDYDNYEICPSRCFECTDKSGCLDRFDFCNNVTDCRDGSDEITTPQSDGIMCTSSRIPASCYLPEKYLCDGAFSCFFGEDECGCNALNHTFQCSTKPDLSRQNLTVSNQCVLRRQFCDNIDDCFGDNSDEEPYNSSLSNGFQCPTTKTGFTFRCSLPFTYVCDGVSECDDHTDECFCDEANRYKDENFWNGRCFRCLDGSLVIPHKQLCDGIFNCQDLSDECMCPHKRPSLCQQLCLIGEDCGECEVGQIQCKDGNNGNFHCIDRNLVCDQHFNCPLKEDENNCNVDLSQMFNCLDQSTYIPLYRQCDNKTSNITDCPDGSDELGCDDDFYKCNEYKEDDFATPIYAKACDGIPTCADLDDECNQTLCGWEEMPGYCQFVEGATGFVCNNSQLNIIGREICDGFPTCNENHPSTSIDELFCNKTTRFYCKDKGANGLPIHIPLSAQCDTIANCVDGSDEVGCNESTHFYCNKFTKPFFIPRDQVCDDNQDCAGGEDECQSCSTDFFASDAFLISSYALQVLIWIVGIVALFGNLAVLYHNVWKVTRKRKRLTKISLHHRILVINVALADFLLGIYLIGVGSVNSRYAGTYCQNDVQWRAGAGCVVLGCLAMISVECSVFSLVAMSTFRLLSVIRPWKTSPKKFIYLAVFSPWFFACLLAFVPLSPTSRDYFVSQVWFRNVPFFTLADRSRVENFTTTFLSISNSNLTTKDQLNNVLVWDRMIEIISRLNSSSFTPELYFGYYSVDGVCLPRIFPDPNHGRAYGYSLFLILVNFLAFIYIAVAYFVIYRTTVRSHKEAGSQRDDTNIVLQRKITRIILSNGCCWIPICIMSFITAAGVPLSSTAYAVSAIVLLPINSAFNPFLYSDVPDIIWRKYFAGTRCRVWTERGSSAS